MDDQYVDIVTKNDDDDDHSEKKHDPRDKENDHYDLKIDRQIVFKKPIWTSCWSVGWWARAGVNLGRFGVWLPDLRLKKRIFYQVFSSLGQFFQV